MRRTEIYLGLYELGGIGIVTGARAAFTLLAAWLLRFCSGALLQVSLMHVAGGRKRCGGCLLGQRQVPSGTQLLHTLIDFNGSQTLHGSSSAAWVIVWESSVDRTPGHSHKCKCEQGTDKKLPR
jgi:hypothetical protein